MADVLAVHLTELTDGLVASLTDEVEVSDTWSEGQHEAVREAVRQLSLGFLRWLRIGDLEAHRCEHLRRLVATPAPGTGDEDAHDLARSVRTDAIGLIGEIAGLGPREQRELDRELEGYLGVLQPAGLRLGDEGELDAWLERIESSGRDVR